MSANATNVNDNDANRLPLPRLEQATGMPLTDNALAVSIDLSSLVQSSVAYGDSTVNQAAISGWLWPMTDEQIALPKLIYVNGRLVKEALISNQMRQLAQSAQLAGMGMRFILSCQPNGSMSMYIHQSSVSKSVR